MVITITMPWWGFLIYGAVLVELTRLADWAGEKTGRALARRIHRRRCVKR